MATSDYRDYVTSAQRVATMVLIFMSYLGNSLTLYVLNRPTSLFRASTNLYLSTLAVMDLLYTTLGPVCFILATNPKEYFNWNIRTYNKILCKVHPFLTYSASTNAVWLIVALTIDRMICTVLPLKAKTFCTKRCAIKITLGICLVIMTINTYILVNNNLMSRNSVVTCENNVRIVPAIMDAVICGLIPIILMGVANFLMIQKLKELKMKKQVNGGIPKNQLPATDLIEGYTITEISPPSYHVSHPLIFMIFFVVQVTDGQSVSMPPIKPKKDKAYKLTIVIAMIFSVHLFYLVTVIPEYAFNLVKELYEVDKNQTLFTLSRLFNTMWYSNFSLHFLLYCSSGPQFRAKIAQLLLELWQNLWCCVCTSARTKEQATQMVTRSFTMKTRSLAEQAQSLEDDEVQNEDP
ncbi:hypothetical protein Ciccas_013028 [Cichlidogyrus casuarinus]|uniref:G-protein coupled receptors family 1 profile domain-containing protein n=1 Tax=Cichlidogyrus casuarinus TaxID=1844966 RepID=A0ABD2PPR8_9PLAT